MFGSPAPSPSLPSPSSSSALRAAAPTFAPRMARAAVIAIIVCISVVDADYVLRSQVPLWAKLLAVPLLAVIAVALVVASGATAPRRRARALLAVAAVVGFGGLPLYGQPWTGMPMLVCGVGLLVLPARYGVPFAALGAATGAVVQGLHNPDDIAGLLNASLAGVLGTLEIFGVTRAAHLATELDEARDELAAAAVDVERARFADDLDGLLLRRLAMVAARCTAALDGRTDTRDDPLDETLSAVRDALAQLRAAARQYRNEPTGRTGRPPGSLRFTRMLTYTLLGLLVGAGAVFIPFREPQPSGWALVATELAVLVVGAGQAVLVSRFDRVRGAAGWVLLAGQTAVLLVPVLVFGVRAGFFAFVSATALLVLTGPARWWVFGGVIVIDLVARIGTGWPPTALVEAIANTIILTLVVAATTFLVRDVQELDRVRQELADAAVTAERARFARDLHDLIGHSLSAIALKTELAQRLLRSDRARAEAEITEVRELARTAITDARALTSGPGRLVLDQEARSAAELLRSADVEVHVDLRPGHLPAAVDAVLATVVREGATNVLRHGGGSRCTIRVERTAQRVHLVIENDPSTAQAPNGSGLRNLAERVAALGGELVAATTPGGDFRLDASVPVAARPPVEHGPR